MKFRGHKNKALFIDRDGVINRMVKYAWGWDCPQKAADVSLLSGIVEIIEWANDKKIPVFEISNQPGAAKGKLTLKETHEIQRRVEELLSQRGAKLDGVYICLHHPEGVDLKLTKKCDCRKPKPGLLLTAAREMDLDTHESVFLGDKETDVLAGKAAGCKTIIFIHNEDEPEKVARSKISKLADFKVKSLNQVIPVLEKILD